LSHRVLLRVWFIDIFSTQEKTKLMYVNNKDKIVFYFFLPNLYGGLGVANRSIATWFWVDHDSLSSFLYFVFYENIKSSFSSFVRILLNYQIKCKYKHLIKLLIIKHQVCKILSNLYFLFNKIKYLLCKIVLNSIW